MFMGGAADADVVVHATHQVRTFAFTGPAT
jgi:hypothetical protein